MTSDEYIDRAREIEEHANRKADAARKSVVCWFGRHGRYTYLADCIRSLACSSALSNIESEMNKEMSELDAEFYGITEEEMRLDEASPRRCS